MPRSGRWCPRHRGSFFSELCEAGSGQTRGALWWTIHRGRRACLGYIWGASSGEVLLRVDQGGGGNWASNLAEFAKIWSESLQV